MKNSLFKRITPLFLCLILCVSTMSGCTRMTEDEIYWTSRWEEEKVWVEYDKENVESTPQNEQTQENENTDNSDSSQSDVSSSDDDTSSESEGGNVGLDPNAKVDSADKPKVKNTANLIKPFTVKSDKQAATLRNKVLNSKSQKVNVKGTVYYISYRGNDDNDGKSPKTPWKTLTKLSYSMQIGEGDAVLFERGGVYRGGISCRNGVYYGAYGTGDKPAIYRSAANYAKSDWIKDSDNIWVAPGTVTDAGVIVFNHGELAGDRKFSKNELVENGDYYSEAGGRVLLYMDKQPAKKFKSIEIGGDSHVFSIPANGHDITIDNITMKYGGAMGVQGANGCKNITVTNCEIGWIGGSVLNGYGDGTVRYGNGIEFWNACENIHVENNWIYQIYDSGFTHQGNGADGFTVKNVLCTKNLIEYCNFASIEYWAPAEGKHKMVDVEYSNNILRFAGYGWGYYGQPAAHIYSTDNFNEAHNFVIKNNILDTALNRHTRCVHHSGTLPKMSGNTFIGKKGERLGSIGISTTSTTYFFDDNTQSAIRADWGDATAKVLFND